VEPDDITEEWETLKTIPRGKPIVENVDLRMERHALAVHPEFVYQITDKSYGVRFMAIWKLRCLGQKIKTFYGYGKPNDVWLVQYHRVLWEGPGLAERRAEEKHTINGERVSRYRYMDPTKTYSLSKKNAHPSLAEALTEFTVVRDRAIELYRDQQRQWRETIAELQGQLAGTDTLIAGFAGFVPQIDDREK
jgi:hypothetical protein